MTNKKISAKSPEFKRLVKEESKLRRKLDSSRVPEAKAGYVMDQWGTYVPEIEVNNLIQTLAQLAEVDNEDESRAIKYSYAGLLVTLNRLDEAEAEYRKLIPGLREPDGPSTITAFLAVIAAKRGDFSEAKRLAVIQNSSEYKCDHISDEDIEREYSDYRKLFKNDDGESEKSTESSHKIVEGNADSPIASCEKVSVDFATALVEDEFEKAFSLVSKSARKEWTVSSLRDAFEEMVGYFEEKPDYVAVTEIMKDWPGKLSDDIACIYVSIACNAEVEAVTLTVALENGEIRIRNIEWGRP